MDAGTDPSDETALVLRAQRGDQLALDALIRANQGKVRTFLAMRLHDVSLADDLAQDAFVIVCDRLHTFDPALPFFPWVRGIAHNVLRHHLRRRQAAPTGPEALAALIDGAVEERAERLGDHDHVELLRHCLGRLEGLPASTVRAHYFDGRSLAEVAADQGRSAKAVGVMLVRARSWLRDCLAMRLRAIAGGTP